MREWPTTTIPLNKGVDDGGATNKLGVAVTVAKNIDFSFEGSVRCRPTFTEVEGLYRKVLNADNSFGNTFTPTRTGMGYSAQLPGMFTARDALGEQPGFMLRGRTFVFNSQFNAWSDRGSFLPLKHNRLWTIRNGIYPGQSSIGAPAISPTAGGAAAYVPAMAKTFGYTSDLELTLFSDTGDKFVTVEPTYSAGAGAGAWCSTTGGSDIMVHVQYGTNNLILSRRDVGSNTVTQTLLATNARIPKGTGDVPSISCDYTETSCYIAYFTTIAVNNCRLLRVTVSTGAVTGNALVYNSGAGTPECVWVSNSAPGATGRVVVNCTTTNGDTNEVYNSVTMASTGIGISLASTYKYCTVGCVDISSGYCIECDTDSTGRLYIYRRSLTAATKSLILNWSGFGGYGVLTTEPSWYLQHQAVLVDQRQLVGVYKTPGWDNINNNTQAGTWLVLDVTDVGPSIATGPGVMINPAIVAKGPSDGTMQPFNPFSAIMSQVSGSTYSFGSVEWSGFRAGNPALHTEVSGYAGNLGMNQVSILNPQYTYAGESTLIAGSVMHEVTRGDIHEVGFPEERPWCNATFIVPGGPTSLAVGTYTVTSVWRWTDEAGQVHRSAPSTLFTTNNPVVNQELVFRTNFPQATQKVGVVADLYCTDVNPTGAALHYLQGTVPVGTATFTIAAVDTTGEVLYTDGNVLENQCPQGDGGCITVGTRTWISDGVAVYASKLPKTGYATAWNLDDPLTVNVPASAGRVVGLAAIEDKVVIMCDRGIFAVTGSGPDDLGSGTSFSDPARIGEMGLQGQRLVQSATQAILFVAANTVDGFVGGMYSIGPNLAVERVSSPITLELATTIPSDLHWWADRQLAVLATRQDALVFDTRSKQWSTWTLSDAPVVVTSAAGYLWSMDDNNNSQGVFGKGTVGYDTFPTDPISMSLTIEQIPSGEDMFKWGRIRSIRLLSTKTAYELDLSLTMDGNRTMTTSQGISTPFSAEWPQAMTPEWRLPTQKCSYFSVTLTSSPGTGTWTGLQVAHRPINNSPNGQRF